NFTETPATDAFLAEIRAEARNEGINYTASRLAAAFNHGFINKSLREVFDVTRMILSAKEELANEPYPIDGLSGEYAEKSLEEWAERLRKGGNQ
ncbi:ead/Ea22-like family protein, partial [Escherichia coli]